MLTIISGYAFLSSAILANKVILKSLPIFLYLGIRMFAAGSLIIVANWKSYKDRGLHRIAQDWKILTVICICTTLIPSLLKAFALQNMPASKVALLGSIDPFITAVYVYFLLNERLTFRKLSGIMLGFLGVVILLTSTSPLEETLKVWSFFSFPELAILASVTISRGGWIKTQNLVRSERYSPLEINGLTMFFSGLTALITAFVTGNYMLYPGSHAPTIMSAMTYSVIAGNIFGYTLYTKALKHNSATLVSLSGFLIPIFVTTGGYFLLGEAITWHAILAGMLLFAGIWLFNTGPKITKKA